jgi:hypothetical protein
MSRTSCLQVRGALLPGSRGLVPVPAVELTGEMDSGCLMSEHCNWRRVRRWRESAQLSLSLNMFIDLMSAPVERGVVRGSCLPVSRGHPTGSTPS